MFAKPCTNPKNNKNNCRTPAPLPRSLNQALQTLGQLHDISKHPAATLWQLHVYILIQGRLLETLLDVEMAQIKTYFADVISTK